MTLIENGIVGEFPYKIVEHPTAKHLMGYIGVPPSHPFYHIDYTDNNWDNPVSNLQVHGGVTFTEHSNNLNPTYYAGDSNDHTLNMNIWWIGFDCGHAGDLSPGIEKLLPQSLRSPLHTTYKDRDYVFAEIEKLATQISDYQCESL